MKVTKLCSFSSFCRFRHFFVFFRTEPQRSLWDVQNQPINRLNTKMHWSPTLLHVLWSVCDSLSSFWQGVELRSTQGRTANSTKLLPLICFVSHQNSRREIGFWNRNQQKPKSRQILTKCVPLGVDFVILQQGNAHVRHKSFKVIFRKLSRFWKVCQFCCLKWTLNDTGCVLFPAFLLQVVNAPSPPCASCWPWATGLSHHSVAWMRWACVTVHGWLGMRD